jgi:adenylyltransferase/sulfurtransferase
VFGVLPGVIGSLMGTEALKVQLEVGEPLSGKLLLYDALCNTFRTVVFPRRADCPVCGSEPSVTTLMDYEAWCGILV